MWKGLYSNRIIDESYKLCPSLIVMINTIPKKLSESTLEIMNNFEILKTIFDEY